MRVFISHTFSEDDISLAETMQKILAEDNVEGYLAEKQREYDLLIRDKIRKEIQNSDHMVAIVTNKAKESASVNQELGYALREGIKPIIMLEENAKAGVLTHGIEPEEFTRENFTQHCKNVTSFILRKGNRIKLTDKEKEQLIENVYVPCYNQMVNVHQNMDFIDFVPENPWKNIPANWKVNTEKEMVMLFDEYTEISEQWRILRSDFIRNYNVRKPKLTQIIVNAFKKTKLLNDDEKIILDEGTISPSDWLDVFRMVIFDWEITSGKDLYRILYDHAKLSQSGHEKWIKQWWDSNNGVHSNLFEIIPDLIDKLDSPISKKMLDDKKAELRESIKKLTIVLENKIKMN